MSKALTIAIAVVVVLCGGDKATAQERPWCLNEPGAGISNCGFHTFAQCHVSRPGGSTYCGPNPAFGGDRPAIEGGQTSGRERRR